MTWCKILVLGEAWGKDEAAQRRPFVGATGRELNRLCEEAGLLPTGTAGLLYRDDSGRDAIYHRAGIAITNVFNFQPPGNKIEALCGPRWGSLPPIRPGKYLREEFVPELDRLKRQIAELRPNVILGLGATALWFAQGTTAISKRRGAVAPSPYGKFLPTFHPAFLMRGAWNLRPVVVFDFLKAAREAEYPDIRRPARFIYIPDAVDDIRRLLPELSAASRIAVDIETAGNQITCIGFSWTREHALVIPIIRRDTPDRCYWTLSDEQEVWRLIRHICHLPAEKTFQNGLYDMRFLWEMYGIPVVNAAHDTMLLHHSLQPEVQKGLGFLGSIYTDEAAWKVMRPRAKDHTIKREDE